MPSRGHRAARHFVERQALRDSVSSSALRAGEVKSVLLATYHAAAAIGETLARVLESSAPRTDPLFSDASFAFVKKLEVPFANGISVYLFRVSVSGARHNFAPRESADGQRLKRALPVDLQYLLTAWSREDARRQSAMLLWAMRVLEDLAELPGNLVNQHYGTDAPPFRGSESTQIALEPLSLQDQVNIWEPAKQNMQPSVSLLARAVPIDTDMTERSHSPAQTREFRLERGDRP